MKNLLALCSVALMLFAGLRPSVAAQTEPLQQGISVQLAIANNAAPMRDADSIHALVVTVTDSGSVYFGIEPTNAAALTEKIPSHLSDQDRKLYIKADARTQYASVEKIFDAVRTAGVDAPVLLTTEPEWAPPGKIVGPRGLEVVVDPSAASGPNLTAVELLSSGKKRPTVKINDRKISWAHVHSALTQSFKKNPDKLVVIKADEIMPFGQIVSVIDTCRATGATVVLLTHD
jgi:biopolymer transport protein ExbD